MHKKHNYLLDKHSGKGVYRFLFTLVFALIGFFAVTYFVTDMLSAKDFFFNKTLGSILFLLLWLVWIFLFYWLSGQLFIFGESSFSRSEIKRFRFLFFLSFAPFLILFFVAATRDFSPYPLLWNTIGGVSFLTQGLVWATLLLYYGGYRRISLQQVILYPLQFLGVTELEESIEKITKTYFYGRVAAIILLVGVVILDALDILNLSVTFYVATVPSVFILSWYGEVMRVKFAKNRIAKLGVSNAAEFNPK